MNATKKGITLMFALVSVLAAYLPCVQGVSAASVNGSKIIFDEYGFIKYALDDFYIIDRREIIKGIVDDKSFLFSVHDWGTSYIYEYETLPSEIELKTIAQEKYASYYEISDQVIEDMNMDVPMICLLIKNNGSPYVIGLERNGSLRKVDTLPYIRYEFDGINHELKDYETKSVLASFSNKGTVVYNDNKKEYVYNLSEGHVCLGRKYDSGYYVHEIEYYGSTSERIDFMTIYDTGSFKIEYLDGDLDFNKILDVSDLTMLSLDIIGDCRLSALQNDAADIDGDGNVTIADLARFRQFLSKKISSFR